MSTKTVHHILRRTIQDAEVKVAADVVDCPVARVGAKEAVDDEVGYGEEQTGNAAGVLLVFVALEEHVKDKFGIWETAAWQGTKRWYGSRVGRARLAHSRRERRVVGSVSTACGVLEIGAGRGCCQRIGQVDFCQE